MAGRPVVAHEALTSAPLRVSGRWLGILRTAWLTLVTLTLVVLFASLPVYWMQLQTICRAASCPAWQTLPAGAQAIQQLGFSLHVWTLIQVIVTAVLELAWLAVGVVIFWYKSEERIALVTSIYLAVFVVNLNNNLDALAAHSPGWRLPIELVTYVGGVSSLLVFYLFPDGRFVPRWTRWPTVAFCGVFALSTFFPGSLLDVSTRLGGLFLVFLAGLGCSGVGVQIYRYRRHSTLTQRQQTKWVVFGVSIAVLGLVGVNLALPDVSTAPRSVLDLLGGIVVILLFLMIPCSIGIALLRSHLWDIDILINRTLVYGALTGSVVGLYILIVGYLGAIFRTGSNLLISLIATGLVAVLFQPLRGWLQHGVNRLVYGQRDEPYAVVARLGRRLEATLAPEAVMAAIVETVAQALKLPYAAITLKQGEDFTTAAAYGSLVEETVTLPLSYQAEPIGQLVLGPRQRGDSFSPADRRLLEDLARQIGMAAHAVRLTADLQRSRERLVTTREEERRRLRRDLHDGLGPTLGGLTLKVGAIRNLLPRDQAAADGLLVELSAEIEGAVGDIRRLVYDLRPPSLDELGLVGAIRARAAQYRLSASTGGLADQGDGPVGGLQVEVDAPEHLPELSAAVEVAAYRIVLEALANVARHAQAHTCRVRLQADAALEVDVSDDGVGLAAERHTGVGLLSMRERAAELGGSCLIESTSAGGVHVMARLPLPKE